MFSLKGPKHPKPDITHRRTPVAIRTALGKKSKHMNHPARAKHTPII